MGGAERAEFDEKRGISGMTTRPSRRRRRFVFLLLVPLLLGIILLLYHHFKYFALHMTSTEGGSEGWPTETMEMPGLRRAAFLPLMTAAVRIGREDLAVDLIQDSSLSKQDREAARWAIAVGFAERGDDITAAKWAERIDDPSLRRSARIILAAEALAQGRAAVPPVPKDFLVDYLDANSPNGADRSRDFSASAGKGSRFAARQGRIAAAKVLFFLGEDTSVIERLLGKDTEAAAGLLWLFGDNAALEAQLSPVLENPSRPYPEDWNMLFALAREVECAVTREDLSTLDRIRAVADPAVRNILLARAATQAVREGKIRDALRFLEETGRSPRRVPLRSLAPDAIVKEAYRFLYGNNTVAAREWIARVSDTCQRAELLGALGNALLQHGKTADAKRAFAEYRALSIPCVPVTVIRLAFELGDVDSAEEMCKKAMSSFSKSDPLFRTQDGLPFAWEFFWANVAYRLSKAGKSRTARLIFRKMIPAGMFDAGPYPRDLFLASTEATDDKLREFLSSWDRGILSRVRGDRPLWEEKSPAYSLRLAEVLFLMDRRAEAETMARRAETSNKIALLYTTFALWSTDAVKRRAYLEKAFFYLRRTKPGSKSYLETLAKMNDRMQGVADRWYFEKVLTALDRIRSSPGDIRKEKTSRSLKERHDEILLDYAAFLLRHGRRGELGNLLSKRWSDPGSDLDAAWQAVKWYARNEPISPTTPDAFKLSELCLLSWMRDEFLAACDLLEKADEVGAGDIAALKRFKESRLRSLRRLEKILREKGGAAESLTPSLNAIPQVKVLHAGSTANADRVVRMISEANAEFLSDPVYYLDHFSFVAPIVAEAAVACYKRGDPDGAARILKKALRTASRTPTRVWIGDLLLYGGFSH